MALAERYVLLDGVNTPGGNGTTNANSGANRAYASLSEWEADEQTDLVSDGDTHLVHCEGTVADTTVVLISGWTTSVSNDITVQVDTDKRHSGIWSNSHYRISVADGDHIYYLLEDYVNTIGLQIELPSSTGARDVIRWAIIDPSNALYFSHMIIRGYDDDTNECVLVAGADSDANVVFENSLFYDAGNQAFSYGFNGSGNHTLSNCTIVNCNTGIRGSDTWVETNVLVEIDLIDGNLCWSNDVSHTRNYCAGNDATANQQGGTGNRDSQTFTFTDAAGGDYSLTGADAGARNFGTDLSGTFTTDITGATRPGESVWDIGAFEFFPAAGGLLVHPGMTGGMKEMAGGMRG